MANKMTQVQALTQAINALETHELVSNEILDKLRDVKAALEKKSGKTSNKVKAAKLDKYESVKGFFSNVPTTLSDVLKLNREELDNMNIISSQALLGAIKPGIESGEIVRIKGKTTTFSLAE